MTSRRGRNPLHLPPSSYEGDRVGLSWCFLLAPKSRPPIMLYCTGGPGKVWREKNWREFYKEREEEEVPCPSARIPQVCLWVSNSTVRDAGVFKQSPVVIGQGESEHRGWCASRMLIAPCNRLPGRMFLESQGHPTSVMTDLPTARPQTRREWFTYKNGEKNDT